MNDIPEELKNQSIEDSFEPLSVKKAADITLQTQNNRLPLPDKVQTIPDPIPESLSKINVDFSDKATLITNTLVGLNLLMKGFTMKSLWNWLNGNKTVFGLAMLEFSQHIDPSASVVGIPVVGILSWVGGLLTTGGVLHKALKSTTEPGPNA